jgi:hypothetical protein
MNLRIKILHVLKNGSSFSARTKIIFSSLMQLYKLHIGMYWNSMQTNNKKQIFYFAALFSMHTWNTLNAI